MSFAPRPKNSRLILDLLGFLVVIVGVSIFIGAWSASRRGGCLE